MFLYRANLTQLGMWFDCRLQVGTVPEAPYYQLPAFPHYQRWGMREMTNLGYQEGKVCFVGGARRDPECTEKRNYVQYAIATTSGCLMSIMLAVVAADWSELVLKDLRGDYFATDIDQSTA